MTIPTWTEEGLLPAGVHSATISEAYERLVLESSDRERSELLFTGVQAHLGAVRQVLGSGRAWIAGALVGRSDFTVAQVVVYPDDEASLRRAPMADRVALARTMSVGSVIVGMPGPIYVDQLDPVAGLVEAHVGYSGQEMDWLEIYSTIDPDRPNLTNGIVEVTL